MKHDSDILKRIKSYFMRRRSAKEAHAFEREIERDQFLYEAVEGYEDMLTSEIQQALDELDDRLDEKTSNKRFIFSWQAAAAVGVIVIGSAVFYYLGQERTTEAASDITISEPQEEKGSYTPRSSTKSFTTIDPVPTNKDIAASNTNDPEQVEPAGDPEPALAVQEPLPSVSTPMEQAEEMDESEAAVAVLEPNTNGSQGAVEKELEMESARDEDIAFEEEMPAETMLDDFDDLRTMSSEEVSAAPRKRARSATPEQAPKEATPDGGMSAYKGYLRNNLNRTSGMPDGKVTLSFSFDRNGKPKDIRVDRSLCTACDAEAIRLVEQGPKWNVAERKERVSMTVEFKR